MRVEVLLLEFGVQADIFKGGKLVNLKLLGGAEMLLFFL